MAWNGTGTYNLPAAYTPEVNGTVVDATRYNGATSDIATGITAALAKNGENSATANLRMGGFKLTGVAAATAAGDAVRFEQANLLVSDATITLAATTSDIGTSASGTILLNGTGVTVTAFPAATVGTVKIVRFNGANTLTDSAALDLPGGNITTASGDCCILHYVAAGWKCMGYTQAAGIGTLLSSLGNAGATATLTNGTYEQIWKWAFNSSGQKGFHLQGDGGTFNNGTVMLIDIPASAQAPTNLLDVQGSPAGGSGSPISLLKVTSSSVFLKGWDAYAGNSPGVVSLIAGSTEIGTGGTVTITGGTVSVSTATGGGAVTIKGGAGYLSGSSTGGDLILNGGSAASVANAGKVELKNGAGSVALRIESPLPTISSGGGAGATIRGSNTIFEVTFGTGSPTDVVVGYTATRGSAGMCLLSGTQAGQVLTYSTSTSGVTISSGTAFSSGTKVTCMVIDTV